MEAVRDAQAYTVFDDHMDHGQDQDTSAIGQWEREQERAEQLLTVPSII